MNICTSTIAALAMRHVGTRKAGRGKSMSSFRCGLEYLGCAETEESHPAEVESTRSCHENLEDKVT